MKCPSHNTLISFLSDGVTDEQSPWIVEHIEGCFDCQLLLDSLTTPKPDAPESVVSPESRHLADLIDRMCDRSMASVASTMAIKRKPRDLPFEPPGAPSEAAPLGCLDHYEILNVLGSGSTGHMVRARDSRLGRIVALKVLRHELCSIPAARVRFEREAKAAAAIQHRNVVRLHEVCTPDGFTPYLVMEYVSGASLHSVLDQQHSLAPRQAAEMAVQIASGLAAAEHVGVVHRDIKPSNIMIDAASDDVKLTDFGLALITDSESGVTLEGLIAGTPAYMSPQQIADPHNVDGQTDTYSLGVVLFEMLTGELPFRGSVRMVLSQVVHDDPPAPRTLNERIPRDLEQICLKAMAREPVDRYRSAADLGEDLTRWLEGRPVAARPLSRPARLWRMCRRRPMVASLSSALLTVAFSSIVGWIYFTISLARARSDAQTSADAVTVQRDVAVSALNALVYEAQDTLKSVPGSRASQKKLLDIALKGLDEVSQASREESIEAELGSLVAINRQGEIARDSGRVDQAAAFFARARFKGHELFSENPNDSRVLVNLGLTLLNLGESNLAQNKWAEAEACYLRAITLFKESVSGNEQNKGRNLSIAYSRLGDFYRASDQPVRAAKRYEDAIDALSQRSTIPLSGKGRDVAVLELKLGSVALELENLPRAQLSIEAAVSIFERAHANLPGKVQSTHDMATGWMRMGELHEALGDAAQSAEYYRRSTGLLDRLRDIDSQTVSVQRDFALSSSLYGVMLVQSEGIDSARPPLERALDCSEELVDLNPDSVEDFKVHVLVSRNLINAEWAVGRKARALELKQTVLSAIQDNINNRTQFTRISEWLEFQSALIRETGANGGD